MEEIKLHDHVKMVKGGKFMNIFDQNSSEEELRPQMLTGSGCVRRIEKQHVECMWEYCDGFKLGEWVICTVDKKYLIVDNYNKGE